MGRDGRSKSKKGRGGGGGRGGGKLFVANIEELQMREEQIHEHQRKRAERRGESDDEGEDETQENVNEEVDDTELALAEQERAARAEARKAQVEDEELEEDVGKTSGLLGGLEIANPNLNRNKMMKTKDLRNMGEGDVEEPQLSRREREALDAARRKAEYDRLHAAGKTDAAKADMKRLAEVRRRREEAEKKCLAEGRKPGWTENGIEDSGGSDSDDDDDGDAKVAKPKAAAAPAPTPSAAEVKKKAAAMEAVDTSGEIPKLSSIDIKKMNADAVKEHLKTRGLSTQGQKKDLMKRLMDYEAAR